MGESGMRAVPPRKESKVRKAATYLKLAADVAGIVMDLRDRPSSKDWFSLALRSANLGIGWYAERKKGGSHQGYWEYFGGSEWKVFPAEYSKIVLASAQELTIADEFLDEDVKLPYACLAKIGKEQVGWMVEAGQVIEGPFYRTDRKHETFEALGSLIWKILGGRHLLYTPGGLVLDTYADKGVIPTTQMNDLLDRMTKFLRADEARGYLLGGVPGTGKSIAIRWLAGVLGLSSVRIDLRLLSAKAEARGGTVAGSLETMLRVLRPDVMILDDLDRIEIDAQVLGFLEMARNSCRIVMASANSLDALSGAVSRPGRFDDIITFDKLDRSVVEKILGEYAHFADEVLELPAAYVAEFARRCRVLGTTQATEDLEELRERAQQTAQDAD